MSKPKKWSIMPVTPTVPVEKCKVTRVHVTLVGAKAGCAHECTEVNSIITCVTVDYLMGRPNV